MYGTCSHAVLSTAARSASGEPARVMARTLALEGFEEFMKELATVRTTVLTAIYRKHVIVNMLTQDSSIFASSAHQTLKRAGASQVHLAPPSLILAPPPSGSCLVSKSMNELPCAHRPWSASLPPLTPLVSSLSSSHVAHPASALHPITAALHRFHQLMPVVELSLFLSSARQAHLILQALSLDGRKVIRRNDLLAE